MAWREEGGMRVAEGYEGDTLYHMRPLGAQNLEKLPAEVLVARSVALRVVKGEHHKGGKTWWESDARRERVDEGRGAHSRTAHR